MSKGGVTIPVFHCIFNDGSITHYDHMYDQDLYEVLDNLYVVCVAKKTAQGYRNVVGGYFIKTSYLHSDPEFYEICRDVLRDMPEIIPLILGDEFILLPELSTIDGSRPASEQDLLANVFNQYFKFHELGRA